jgi:peroxiredoxin
MALLIGELAPTFVRRPVFGLEIDTGAITTARPLALVFLRHAGSPVARETAMKLNTAWPEIERLGVSLLAVTEGSSRSVRDFVPRFHLLFPVVHDDTGTLYSGFGVGLDRGLFGTLSCAPASVTRYLRACRATHGAFEGPRTRLQAAFVIAKGGRIAWSWHARTTADIVEPHGVLRALRMPDGHGGL